ncbi:hypothetical protein D3C78_1826380 [compost metagenome]
MAGDFTQRGFQASLLVLVAMGLGQFDLVDDALALGRAAGELRGLLVRHQRGGHGAA